MNKYLSYKDSEVGWIGKIPNTWKVSRVKKYFKERNEKVSDLDFPPLSVTKRGILPQLDNVSKSDNHNDRKRVCKNDFVINSRSDRKGSSGMSVLDGSVSLINIVLEPKSITPKYSEYIFKSKDFIEEFFRNGKGIHWDLWSTRFSELQNIKIPIPSLFEQQQIVSFLDTKTSLIDSLIEKTQRKIELLKEKRTSLINEVVTKGLNPNVEMKDSGVEWIGEIPSHWGLSKLGFLSKPVQGIQVDVENQLYNQHEGSERFIRISDYTMEEEPRYIDSYPESSIVNEEDLVMVRYGSKSGKVYSGIKGVICNNVFRIEHNEKLYTKFLSYFLNQESFYNQIEMSRDNNTLPQVSHGLYKEMKITLPVILEQHQIVEYLDEQTQIIDNTISIEEKRIELLKEYRQSLISEVVTGKRKVVE